MTVDPLLVVLLVFCIISFLLCFAWCAACCCFGTCCPVRLQRALGILAFLVFFASVVSTAAAYGRIQQLWSATVEVASFSYDIGQVAIKHARQH